MKIVLYRCNRCGEDIKNPYVIKPLHPLDKDLYQDVHVCVSCVNEVILGLDPKEVKIQCGPVLHDFFKNDERKPVTEPEQSVRENEKAELKAKVEGIEKVKTNEKKPKKTLIKPKAIVRNNTDWSFLPEEKQKLFAAIDKGKYFAFMRTHRTKEFIRVEFGIDIEDVDILRQQWGEELKEYLSDPDAWAKKTYGFKKLDEE